MNLNLRDMMTLLVSRAEERVKELSPTAGDLHYRVCDSLATEYNLWDDQDLFPVWLSRVVEGVMQDLGVGDSE